MFLATGFVLLEISSLAALTTLAPWVWMALFVAVLLSLNEAIMKSARQDSPMVYSFWIGLFSFVLSLAAFFLLGNTGILFDVSQAFWIDSVVMGVIVILMVLGKLMSFRKGRFIAMKNIVV